MAGPDPRVIEALAVRAWPPRETKRLAGWRLHFSGGFSRRANSAAPARATVGIDEILRAARAWYADRGLSFVVRITPGDHEVDRELERRGYSKEGLTEVMALPLEGFVAPPVAPDAEVAVDRDPAEPWLDLQVRLQAVPQPLRESWEGILRRIEPETGFGLARSGTHYVGAGLAVHDEAWVGLFEINVDTPARRRRYGTTLSAALLDWAVALGAEYAYLQVTAENVAAREMYRALGFEPAYRYWYRRAPDTPAE